MGNSNVAEADWTDEENDLIVTDYFAMLEDEIVGRPYIKAERNRELQQVLNGRGRGSIEFKHQNISAVLLGLGQLWIMGYKPASRFQNSLIDAVLRWLDARPDWLVPQKGLLPGAGLPRSELREDATLWIGPAPTFANEPPPVDVEMMSALGRKYDVAARDAGNRLLGRAGEERVLAHEISSLRLCGREDLASKVRWTSVEDGDGYGYGIASFEPDGQERLVEVKATNGWERTPFHITRNELNVADAKRETWHLLRLWNFVRELKAFSIRPPLDAHVRLTPTSFLASIQ